jgi:hypothetical protein
LKRAPRGFGPHLPGSLVLAALLVAVVVSRVAQPSRSDAAGALYSAGVAWTITAEGQLTVGAPGYGCCCGDDHMRATMSSRERVAGFWDDVVGRWLAGEDPMPDPLNSWFGGYGGRGAGAVTRDAFAEPWIGPMRGEPRLAVLGLNPGRANLEFQGRTGLFADEIRATSGFSEWAATSPYSREPWTEKVGPNRYHDQRETFARRFYDDPSITAQHVLAMELYPWHSTSVTGVMSAPRDVLDSMVWAPLAELGVREVFAFGRPWVRVAEDAGLKLESHLGAGGTSMDSSVASRTVLIYRMASGQRLVVSWQSGYAGPPGAADTSRLRDILLR